jgi:hypothetical protein
MRSNYNGNAILEFQVKAYLGSAAGQEDKSAIATDFPPKISNKFLSLYIFKGLLLQIANNILELDKIGEQYVRITRAGICSVVERNPEKL